MCLECVTVPINSIIKLLIVKIKSILHRSNTPSRVHTKSLPYLPIAYHVACGTSRSSTNNTTWVSYCISCVTSRGYEFPIQVSLSLDQRN